MDNNLTKSKNIRNSVTDDSDSELQGNHYQANTHLKKCPFCAELIQPEAIKCRFCGEFLHGFKRNDINKQSNKWYQSTTAIITLLLIVGPLALPAVWLNPRYKIMTKVIITVVVMIFTVFLVYLMGVLYSQFLKQFDSLGSGIL